MSIRLSFGHRWFEIHFMESLMAGAFIYLSIKCGHNSTRNLITWRRGHSGKRYFQVGRKFLTLTN